MRVHSTRQHRARFNQMNGAGFGRLTGWLLGPFTGAPVMLSISHRRNFWVLLLGIATFSTAGCVVGHFMSS